MGQPITDYPAFFEGAKAALLEVNRLKEQEEQQKEEEEESRAELAAEQRALKDAVETTIQKRIGEINTTYDTEISKNEAELKKIQANRERAKNIGIKDRIREETRPLLDEIKERKKELKALFREQHVSPLFRTRLYYALYFPHKIGQWFTLLLFIALFFVLCPCAIYFLALPENWRNPISLVVIYVADILLFGGIYVGVGNVSKLNHLEALRKGRELWDQIDSNRRRVKKLKKQINRDQSEDQYDLASFDDELTHMSRKLQEVKEKKQDALRTFDTVTKNILIDELTQNARPKITQLTEKHACALRLLQEVSADRQRKTLSLADQYEAYLGKEFMSLEKINALQTLVESGAASNLLEAIEAYRKRQE